MITDSFREDIAGFIIGEPIESPKAIGFGIGTRELSIGDLELEKEIYRKDLTARYRRRGDIVRVNTLLYPNEPPVPPGEDYLIIREIGLFTGGSLTLPNEDFEEWVDSTPKDWVLGPGLTTSKETLDVYQGNFAVRLMKDASLPVSLIFSNIPPQLCRGKRLTFRAALKPISGNIGVLIQDNIGQARAFAIGPNWQIVSVSYDVSPVATSCLVGIFLDAPEASASGLADWTRCVEQGRLWARQLLDLQKDRSSALNFVWELGILGEEEKIMAFMAFAKEELVVSSTARGFTPAIFAPPGETPAQEVLISVEEGSIRVWFDGSTPTPVSGHFWPAGTKERVSGTKNILQMRMIRAGLADALVKATFFR